MALDPTLSRGKHIGGGEALRTRSSEGPSSSHRYIPQAGNIVHQTRAMMKVSSVAIDLGPRAAANNDANTTQT